jgi:hypothetical protein
MFGIGDHFSTEAKLMLAVLLVPLAVGLAVALVWPNIDTWLAVDRCLDAGGKYDYAANACVLADRAPR